MNKKRCGWVNENPLMIQYHDREWGHPSRKDEHLFEMICLEGAQAGLSWETILNKREAYRKAFHHFDPQICARLTDSALRKQMYNAQVVRNRLKIWSVRDNARAFLGVQKEFGSFSKYLWNYVGNKPLLGKRKTLSEIPAQTELSDQLSRDLKNRGFRFVGTTICYAFLQAVGVVNDHTRECYLFNSGR